MKKIALVGIGKIARDQHLPTLVVSHEWSLAATVSRSAGVDGIEGYRDIARLLAARPDIDALALCLPPVPRFSYAQMALAAGRHVMLEKPPGATLSECEALINLAKSNNLALYASWHSREGRWVPTVKTWLVDKTLKRLTITWKEDVRRWHPGQAWIFAAGGLGVFDPFTNALSIVTEVLPDSIHVKSADLDIPCNCQTPIAGELSFYHPSGAVVTATMDFLQTGEQTWLIDIETDQGELRLAGGGVDLWIDGDKQTPTAPAEVTADGEYPRLYRRFSRLVDERQIDVDLRPMQLVADALLLGCIRRVAAFEF